MKFTIQKPLKIQTPETSQHALKLARTGNNNNNNNNNNDKVN